MAVVDELLRLFARSIHAKATALKAPGLSPNHFLRLRSSITAEVRTCGGLLYPEVRPPEVSQAALREAERVQVDLRAETWLSQVRFDRGRRVFHWEHVDPISRIRAACLKAGSEQAVLDVVRTRLRIAWILKSEDRELTRLKFRSHRPEPDEAYRAAGIVLVGRPNLGAEPNAAPGCGGR